MASQSATQTTNDVSKWQSQRTHVMNQMNSAAKFEKLYRSQGNSRKYQTQLSNYRKYDNELQTLNREISAANQWSHGTKSSNGLTSLQNSILKLQQASMDYTQHLVDTGTNSSTASQTTSIQGSSANDGMYVTGIGLNTVTVANGTTAAELEAAIQSTDGSTQSYSVTDGNGNALGGALTTGDVLAVTAANGSTTHTYVVIVNL